MNLKQALFLAAIFGAGIGIPVLLAPEGWKIPLLLIILASLGITALSVLAISWASDFYDRLGR